MRITVFGAAGSVGSRVVTEALARGHDVTAVVRDTARFSELDPKANAQVGDASKIEDVVKLSTDQDIVITATRPAAGNESELVRITQSLLTGMNQSGVRLLLVGGAGGLTVPNSNGTLVVDDPKYVAPAWRDIAVACVEQLELCLNDKETNWTYLSPAAMMLPGERTGQFRLGQDELLIDADGESQISVEDLAVALVDEAEQVKFPRARFTVAY